MNTLKQELKERINHNFKLIEMLEKENYRNEIMLQEIEDIQMKGGNKNNAINQRRSKGL